MVHVLLSLILRAALAYALSLGPTPATAQARTVCLQVTSADNGTGWGSTVRHCVAIDRPRLR